MVVGLSQPAIDGRNSYWIEMRPSEAGRSVVIRRDPAGFNRDITPAQFNARTPPGPIGNDCRNTTVAADGSVYALYYGEGVSRLRDGVWRNFEAGVTCGLPGCDPDTTFASSTFPFGMLIDPDGKKWISMWAGPLVRFDDEANPPVFQNILFQSVDAILVHLHSTIHTFAADANPGDSAGVWMGLDTVRAARRTERLMVSGDRELISDMQTWLGLSPFAKAAKVTVAA